MSKMVFMAALGVGMLLIFFGIDSSNYFNSGVSRFITGSPTDKALWMFICGIVASLVGLGGLARARV